MHARARIGAHGRTHGAIHGTTHAATHTLSNPHNDTYVYRSERMNTTHMLGGRVFSRRLITATISAPHPYFLRKIFLYPCNPARLQRPDRFYTALRLPWHSHYHPRPALPCLCYSHAISTCFPSLRAAELTIWAKKRDEARWLSEGFCTADFRWLIDRLVGGYAVISMQD